MVNACRRAVPRRRSTPPRGAQRHPMLEVPEMDACRRVVAGAAIRI